ncbi:MAG TPA: hypothetical protein DCL73_01295 [Treponema sp.]|nr:hypothetical protein [Treponema sp.]
MTDALKMFSVSDSFFGRYEELVVDTVIPYQEKILNDAIPGVEKSHAVENFRQAAEVNETGKCSGEFYGMVFQDSDVAKWLEAAAYSLAQKNDPALEKRCDDMITLIGRAQKKDGYLDTYFTVKEPGRQWTDLQEAHELYCSGHMMEAAVAYYECTGRRNLLDIMCRAADHIYDHFITHNAPGYPGHPEVELALMRMYHATGNGKYKELAEHFINVRGVDGDYFKCESETRGWQVWGGWNGDREYTLCHEPVRGQKDAVGHAVRAVYLYSGMASVAKENGDETLKAACLTLWNSITQKRMYVTGAIGSAYEGESFTKDYHLPNDTAYGETCASVGLIFFARRMLDLFKSGEYGDVMERALYNCVLAGMQLDGKRFFYVNVLESLPGISGKAVTHRHALPQRPQWFTCACCPPNAARLIASIGRYAWCIEDGTAYAVLYIGGTLDGTEQLGGKIHVETSYPYEGSAVYTFEPCDSHMDMTLALRLPSWSRSTKISMNGKEIDCTYSSGYAFVKGPFTASDAVAIEFDMGVRRIHASPKVSADSGKTAFMRGPLVYCAEGADNNGGVLNLIADRSAVPAVGTYEPDSLYGIRKITVAGTRTEDTGKLYSDEPPSVTPCTITLIPYYAWANRGENEMRVWLPER